MVELPNEPIAAKNLVAGEWRDAASGDRMDVVSPYTNTVIGSIPVSAAADVGPAVAAAKEAAESWRAVPLKERTQTLFRFRELVLENIDQMSN
ncbi:MAG: aldehyde dehydrogenase family protein, partial [Deltaproteobacteria bacterium]|nr:aldehyde dehydrogenase family protein [Deltaproteobacteria bacterium]